MCEEVYAELEGEDVEGGAAVEDMGRRAERGERLLMSHRSRPNCRRWRWGLRLRGGR